MELISEQREKILLSRLKEGDPFAFKELYSLYSSPIYYFVYAILSDKSLAEDITQSCFVKVWERRTELDLSKKFSAYLYTIAKNLVYRESERQVRDARYLEFVKGAGGEKSQTVEEAIHLKFIQEEINNMINELPPARKKIFVLSRFKGYSNKKIVEELSVSERTVETQIYRTLLYLKERLMHYLLLFVLVFIS